MSSLSRKIEQPVHGAFDYAQLESLGLHPEEVIDFSVNSHRTGHHLVCEKRWRTLPLIVIQIVRVYN